MRGNFEVTRVRIEIRDFSGKHAASTTTNDQPPALDDFN